MSKLIKTWSELLALPPSEKGYTITEDYWIVPVQETQETEDKYYEHHIYLSTHTFYERQYKKSTEIMKKFGWDVEIDNWDRKLKYE